MSEQMSDRIKWIEHKGMKILHVDFSNLSGDDFLNAIIEVEKVMLESNVKTIYYASNFTNVTQNNEIKKRADKIIVNLTNNGQEVVMTIFGISGLSRIIAKAVKPDIYFARNEEEALEWLVGQAEKAEQPVG